MLWRRPRERPAKREKVEISIETESPGSRIDGRIAGMVLVIDKAMKTLNFRRSLGLALAAYVFVNWQPVSAATCQDFFNPVLESTGDLTLSQQLRAQYLKFRIEKIWAKRAHLRDNRAQALSLIQFLDELLKMQDPNLKYEIVDKDKTIKIVFQSSPSATSELGKEITKSLSLHPNHMFVFDPLKGREASQFISRWNAPAETILALRDILNPHNISGIFFHELTHQAKHFDGLSGQNPGGNGYIKDHPELFGYERLYKLEESEAHLVGIQYDLDRKIRDQLKNVKTDLFQNMVRTETALTILQSLTGRKPQETVTNEYPSHTEVTYIWNPYVRGHYASYKVRVELVYNFPRSNLEVNLDEFNQIVLQNEIKYLTYQKEKMGSMVVP